MRYQIAIRPAVRHRILFYQGYIIDLEIRKVVHEAEMLSEEYLTQTLNNKIRKFEAEDAKLEKEKGELVNELSAISGSGKSYRS